MIFYKFMYILLVIPFGQTVKVNMQGALSLGKEITDTLVNYIQKKMLTEFIGRRSGSGPSSISIIVNSATLCRHLNFCNEKYEKIINDYIITQTESIETIFKHIIKEEREEPNAVIFEEELKTILKEIRIYLENISSKVGDDMDISVWMELLKKISISFKDKAMAFGLDRIEGNDVDVMHVVKKKLHETLTIATASIELEYEKTLCSNINICYTKYKCSKSLHDLLEMISVLNENKIKEFIRIFSESLTQSGFYDSVSAITADEFRYILSDMAVSNTIETKNVFSILKDIVKSRLDVLKTDEVVATGKDVKLVHIILSDLDYLYNIRKTSALEDFLIEFNEWSKSGGNLNTEVSKVMTDLTKTALQSEDLADKLMSEVKMFLEITVDPEH